MKISQISEEPMKEEESLGNQWRRRILISPTRESLVEGSMKYDLCQQEKKVSPGKPTIRRGQGGVGTQIKPRVDRQVFSYSIFDTESKSSSLSEYSPVRVQESVWVLGDGGRRQQAFVHELGSEAFRVLPAHPTRPISRESEREEVESKKKKDENPVIYFKAGQDLAFAPLRGRVLPFSTHDS